MVHNLIWIIFFRQKYQEPYVAFKLTNTSKTLTLVCNETVQRLEQERNSRVEVVVAKHRYNVYIKSILQQTLPCCTSIDGCRPLWQNWTACPCILLCRINVQNRNHSFGTDFISWVCSRRFSEKLSVNGKKCLLHFLLWIPVTILLLLKPTKKDVVSLLNIFLQSYAKYLHNTTNHIRSVLGNS